MPNELETRVVGSALWAAAGDALGFITELTDAQGLKWRVGSSFVTTTTRWRRSVGGKFGAVVDFPAGAYSDDTQLRLATSRAIRSDGHFDVEAFAKVELPLWLCYALGGGRSTKAAAGALGHPDVNWYSNFFETKAAKYTDAGGNGAAMRVQPHIWASKAFAPTDYVPNIIRNAVCTHGHMRAIFSAVFHGFCLGEALRTGEAANPDVWRSAIECASQIPQFVRRDPELSAFWLPVWEAKAKSEIERSCEAVRRECEDDIEKLATTTETEGLERYKNVLERLGCLSAESRGSGTKTALLAAWLAWEYRGMPPLDVLTLAANVLSSDTDTIGTMAGALLGATAKTAPSAELMDRDYLTSEAERLGRIAGGQKVSNFEYPDLLSWKAPKTQLDAVGSVDGRVMVAGFGEAEAIGTKYSARKTDGSNWQWLRLRFGQTILSKQRDVLPAVQKVGPPDRRVATSHANLGRPKVRKLDQTPMFGIKEAGEMATNTPPSEGTIDELTGEAIRSGFNAELIGKHFLAFAEVPDGIEKALAYSAIMIKARRARLLSSHSEKGDAKRAPNAGEAAS